LPRRRSFTFRRRERAKTGLAGEVIDVILVGGEKHIMYKIIGADLKEYGPSSAEELRQWVREGRADGRTLVRAEGGTEWKPLASFPELAAALAESPFATMPPTPSAVDPASLPADLLERDWDLDIGYCIRRSWELVKTQFWPVVGVTLVVFMAMGGINQFIGLFSRSAMQEIKDGHFSARGITMILLTSLISLPIETMFTAGLLRYYLKLIRGEPVEFGDAFTGFSLAPVQLMSLGFIQNLLIILGFGLCIVPGIYLAVAWHFSIILVIDKRLDFWPAMELSRKVVTRHWFVILGLVLLNGLISVAGICAVCIGVIVTGPIAVGSLAYAYEDIFGHRAAPKI
jgi:hypothetical protein